MWRVGYSTTVTFLRYNSLTGVGYGFESRLRAMPSVAQWAEQPPLRKTLQSEGCFRQGNNYVIKPMLPVLAQLAERPRSRGRSVVRVHHTELLEPEKLSGFESFKKERLELEAVV